MSNVYCVYTGEYDDVSCQAIFSSEELAQLCVNKLFPSDKPRIIEMPIDKDMSKLARYWITIDSNGLIDEFGTSVVLEYNKDEPCCDPYFSIDKWTIDENGEYYDSVILSVVFYAYNYKEVETMAVDFVEDIKKKYGWPDVKDISKTLYLKDWCGSK